MRDNPVEEMRPAVFIDAELGDFRDPVLVAFVPPAIVEWARKWRISAPDLEVATIYLRTAWRKNPKARKTCRLTFASVSGIAGNEFMPILSEPEWRHLRVPQIGANPMIESETEFLKRARAHYVERVNRYYLAPATDDARAPASVEREPQLKRKFAPRRIVRELHNHANWLVRVQVAGASVAEVARTEHKTRAAVDDAVRRLAEVVGLSLRKGQRTGRPLGRGELKPRRRVR